MVRIEEPDPEAVTVTAEVLKEDVRPLEGATLSSTVPENPFPLVRSMFEVPGTLADRVMERWSAEIPKSTTLTVTVTE